MVHEIVSAPAPSPFTSPCVRIVGKLEFHFDAGKIRHRMVESKPIDNVPSWENGEIISVPVATLDNFAAGGGPLPQLVKIDVEGGEYEVLRGGGRLFAKQPPLNCRRERCRVDENVEN
jgi:hypothetical protein